MKQQPLVVSRGGLYRLPFAILSPSPVRFFAFVASLLVLAVAQASAQQKGLLEPHEVILEDFESDDALERWRFDRNQAGAEGGCTVTLSREWSSHGERSARILFRAGDGWPNMQTFGERFADWPNFAEFEYLEMALHNPADYAAPMAGDHAHGLVFFMAEGPRPNSINANLDARQTLHLSIDIHERLGLRQGQPLDPSKVNAFHFYAWNPSVDYVRYVDHIRLTRDLGRHVDGLEATLTMLGAAGMSGDVLAKLREQVTSERQRLAALSASAENLVAARGSLAALEAEIARHDVLTPRFGPRILALLSRRDWGEETRRQVAALEQDMSDALANLPSPGEGSTDYEARALERLAAEDRILRAQLATAATVLPQVTERQGLVVGWAHGNTFVKPYGQAFEGGFGPASVAGARGETVAFQVVVLTLDQDVPGTKVEVLPGNMPAEAVRIKALGFMNLGTAPEGSPAFQEQWYPDILYPAPSAGITIPAATPQPYLLEIDIPRDAAAGLHSLSVSVTSQGGSCELPVRLQVYDFDMPERFSLKTTCHHRAGDAPVLVRYGLDPGGIYGGWHKASDEDILAQFRLGQQLFNVANQKGGWLSYTRRKWAFDPARGTLEENWERYLERYEPFLRRMEELGIPRKHFFFYGFDEVPPSDAIGVYNDRLRALGVPVMGTPMGSGWPDQAADTFDMWAGGLGKGEEARRARIAQIHAAGKEAWWYDNNLGFDPDAWIARQKGWYAKHWGMSGYLIYSAHAWSARDDKRLDLASLPYSNWREPSRSARGAACALTYYWGDRAEERYPSFRLTCFRAGLYDYEYLTRLQDVATQVSEQGTTSRYRDTVARALELANVPKAYLEIDRRASAALLHSLPEPLRPSVGTPAFLAARREAAALIEQLQPLVD